MTLARQFRKLPPGFVGLQAEVGAILRQRRTKGGYGKQAAVAAQVGIAPETLSRIENGKAIPRPETLEGLLVALDLAWDKVAIRDKAWVPDEKAATSWRRDRMLDAGGELREARRKVGMTLRELKRHGSPEAITTDGLRSYGAAMNELGNRDKQEIGRWANNRVENSHLPFRRRERAMLRFRQMKTLQKFRLCSRQHPQPLQPGTPPRRSTDLQATPLSRPG
jgi:DNA-binding XRE family transcriptional regulator